MYYYIIIIYYYIYSLKVMPTCHMPQKPQFFGPSSSHTAQPPPSSRVAQHLVKREGEVRWRSGEMEEQSVVPNAAAPS